MAGNLKTYFKHWIEALILTNTISVKNIVKNKKYNIEPIF